MAGHSFVSSQFLSSRIVIREVILLTLEQARVMVKYISGHRLEVLLAMAVVTGMRRGELLSLRWSDVERWRLLVMHSIDFMAHYGYIEDKPKTTASKRLISLPSFLLDMLEKHRTQ